MWITLLWSAYNLLSLHSPSALKAASLGRAKSLGRVRVPAACITVSADSFRVLVVCKYYDWIAELSHYFLPLLKEPCATSRFVLRCVRSLGVATATALVNVSAQLVGTARIVRGESVGERKGRA